MLTHSERGVNTQVCEQWFEKGVNTCEQCFEKVLTQSVGAVCERSPNTSGDKEGRGEGRSQY